MDSLKRDFLLKVWHTELYDREDEIIFTYNRKKLEFNAETKIKDFFGNNSDIEIEVNDVNNILPTVPFQKYNILFKSSNGINAKVEIDYKDTMENMLKYY